MWNSIPLDLLSSILSFLSPDALACARSTCRHWYDCGNHKALRTHPFVEGHLPPWFLAWPMRGNRSYYYVHNPALGRWYELSLQFLCFPVRPMAPIGGIILSRVTTTASLQLGVCNLFAKQFKHLPLLNFKRTNPAIGVVSRVSGNPTHFRVYVAGGMSEGPLGGATYEPSLEVFDSVEEKWRIVGGMPVEFAVRLTVWTPNESVHYKGVLFWITSARVYSVMSLEIGSNNWQELSVPMADKLEFAALVARDGGVTLVGGARGGRACVWKLNQEEKWELIETVPKELGMKLAGENESWCRTKCAGIDGTICLYKDLDSGMIVWREIEQNIHKWDWVEGYCSMKGRVARNVAIRGVIIQPNLVCHT